MTAQPLPWRQEAQKDFYLSAATFFRLFHIASGRFGCAACSMQWHENSARGGRRTNQEARSRFCRDKRRGQVFAAAILIQETWRVALSHQKPRGTNDVFFAWPRETAPVNAVCLAIMRESRLILPCLVPFFFLFSLLDRFNRFVFLFLLCFFSFLFPVAPSWTWPVPATSAERQMVCWNNVSFVPVHFHSF